MRGALRSGYRAFYVQHLASIRAKVEKSIQLEDVANIKRDLKNLEGFATWSDASEAVDKRLTESTTDLIKWWQPSGGAVSVILSGSGFITALNAPDLWVFPPAFFVMCCLTFPVEMHTKLQKYKSDLKIRIILDRLETSSLAPQTKKD